MTAFRCEQAELSFPERHVQSTLLQFKIPLPYLHTHTHTYAHAHARELLIFMLMSGNKRHYRRCKTAGGVGGLFSFALWFGNWTNQKHTHAHVLKTL